MDVANEGGFYEQEKRKVLVVHGGVEGGFQWASPSHVFRFGLADAQKQPFPAEHLGLRIAFGFG